MADLCTQVFLRKCLEEKNSFCLISGSISGSISHQRVLRSEVMTVWKAIPVWPDYSIVSTPLPRPLQCFRCPVEQLYAPNTPKEIRQ